MATVTSTTDTDTLHVAGDDGGGRLQFDPQELPLLSPEQCGHLRHFHNLATQIDGEWRHMGTQEPAQEFLDALRYQLAVMSYATGLAHYHHQPVLRSVYKTLFRQLISKMLRREVWMYWFCTSQSGKFVDPSLTELRKPWADPCVKENIMYSGHLLLMLSMYAMLFDDDEFEKPDSVVFNWTPLFWGMGPEQFKYSTQTLQEGILAEMESNNWLGVCCEPNSTFVVCNQFPLIAVRYNDVRRATSTVDGILEKYQAAWSSKGGRSDKATGLYHDWYRVKQDDMVPPSDIGFTAWADSMMNTWNSDEIYAQFDSRAKGYLVNDDMEHTTVLNSRPVAHYILQKLASDSSLDPNSAELLAEARAAIKANPPPAFPYVKPSFGYVCKWLSELGRTRELEGILAYADRYLCPTHENGGLFYPRNDQREDANGNPLAMDPFTGNAAIGYARLNVKDGQRTMYRHPWDKEHFRKTPWIDGVDLGSGVDFLRGAWVEEQQALVLTMRTWDGRKVDLSLVARNLPEGKWAVFVDGSRTSLASVEAGGSVPFKVAVSGDNVTVVLTTRF